MTRSGGSILTADFGSVTTRVTLVDVVDGEYRLVARGTSPTTVGYPIDDISVGLQQILTDIANATGRTFYDAKNAIITPENADRSGVDYFLATASAGRAMRVVVVGLLPDFSIESALRAMTGAYAEPVAQLHLRDGLGEAGRLNAVLLSRPDLIFIAGGTEGGAQTALLELLKPVRLALQVLDPSLRPNIIYAGNNRLVETIKTFFGDLTGIFVAENVRPEMESELLEAARIELGHAYDILKEKHGEGFSLVGRMSSTGVLPTAQSYGLITQYFAQVRGGNVLAVDMGSSSTVLAGVFAGDAYSTIGTTLGVGHSAVSLLEQVGAAAIESWLPFFPQPGELMTYALNKSLRPATLPLNLRDLYLEQAFIRAGIQFLLSQARSAWESIPATGALPPIDLLLVGGAPLTGTGYPDYNLLLIADAIQPTGITEVKADPHGLIPALGAMAQVSPEAVVQLLGGDSLDHLGIILTVSGDITPEKKALRLKVKTEEGETVTQDIRGGHAVLLPLPAGVSMELDITLPRGLHMGGSRRIKRKFYGGSAGLLIDARGRALSAGATVADRAQNLPLWVAEASTDPEARLQTIPDDWRVPPEIDPELEDEMSLSSLLDEEIGAAQPTRRGLFGRRQKPIPAPTPVAADSAADSDLEDEFMTLIGDAEPEAKDRPSQMKRRKQQELDDELGSLRELL
jgi:uncharacterized protein (TIGR01319 family)